MNSARSVCGFSPDVREPGFGWKNNCPEECVLFFLNIFLDEGP